MNKVLVVDFEQNRNPRIIIAHATRNGDHCAPTDGGYNIIEDMEILCDAICTLMHIAEKLNVQESPASLRQCINFLEQGFADANYKVST